MESVMKVGLLPADEQPCLVGPDADVAAAEVGQGRCEHVQISLVTGEVGPWPKVGRTFEVGARKAGVYGLFDMSGNAWEWVNDWYSTSWAACGAKCQGINPKGPCGGKDPCPGHTMRVVRGGSWYWTAEYATGAARRPHYPNNRSFHHFGFRCAASVGGETR